MSQSVRPSVFGNVHLGYIVIETQKFSDWRRFGRDAIGMHLDDRSFANRNLRSFEFAREFCDQNPALMG